MPGTIELIILLGSTILIGAFTFRRINALIVPRLLDGFVGTEAARTAAAQASAVVHRGVRTVIWPVFAMSFVGSLVCFHMARAGMAVVFFGAIVALSGVWHMIAVRRWWRWAIQTGSDMALVEELAEDANLVWRHTTWMGRRQQRTWRRLSPVDGSVGIDTIQGTP
jgi:hypothetical protein